LSMVSKRSEVKTECLIASCEHKHVNSNAFQLNFLAQFQIFWVYMSANLISTTESMVN
jgi:cellulose synthase/poly-beta-1,6-N-acetylglucosamine synthase-like glycosyltransferase